MIASSAVIMVEKCFFAPFFPATEWMISVDLTTSVVYTEDVIDVNEMFLSFFFFTFDKLAVAIQLHLGVKQKKNENGFLLVNIWFTENGNSFHEKTLENSMKIIMLMLKSV